MRQSWQVIVIGKEASRVSEAQALDYVYGYTVGNDFSNRTWQLDKTLSGGQWCFSKSFDASAPIGPAIVSKEALGDAANLSIRANLNGETMQDSNTGQMIFGAAKLVSFLSQAMTLLPGTLIFTGTPAGVGLGRSPQVVVKEGDVTLRTPCSAPPLFGTLKI
ncbi:fumarylacetoacetate hydrolase [Pyricularia oryzae]|nr:fumarylacetoacetate hydrolase [Pyricularia oryzae]